MRKRMIAMATAGVLSLGGTVACGTSTSIEASGTPKIGVILPDSKTSARWETADRRYLQEAFEAAGVSYDIQNAQNDKQAFTTIADQMITNGVTVLMITNLDSGTGKAVLDKAKSLGIATIDYDRLTLGGSASYYVSFDNVAVGRLQGSGLVTCMAEAGVDNPTIAELNGSKTDNNATMFKTGYDSVLDAKYDSGEFAKGPDQWVPEWDNSEGAVIFEQMLTLDKSISGVLAANDGLGNAVISVLRKNNLNGVIPVTGQDATVQGLRNILLGDQCMTVYKNLKQEAQAAAELAISLANNEERTLTESVYDPTGDREVPALLLEPKAIFANNVKDVVDDGFVTVSELCTGDVAARCAELGIS